MNIKVFKGFTDHVMRGFNREIDVNLRNIEMHLLVMVNEQPNRPLHVYARHIGLEKGSFTYLLEVLEEKGYLLRKEDSADRRRKYIVLTEKGKEVTAYIQDKENAYVEKVLNTFSIEEQQTIKDAAAILDNYLKKEHEKHGKRHPDGFPEPPRGE